MVSLRYEGEGQGVGWTARLKSFAPNNKNPEKENAIKTCLRADESTDFETIIITSCFSTVNLTRTQYFVFDISTNDARFIFFVEGESQNSIMYPYRAVKRGM